MAEALQDLRRAKWTYEELIENYPDSVYAKMAKEKLSVLKEKTGNNLQEVKKGWEDIKTKGNKGEKDE
jgi:outer membrane protein assembly factor BamD (BamD/ComL family)